MPVDRPLRVLGRLLGLEDMGRDEEEQLRALKVSLVAVAEDVADDRDLIEEAELLLVGGRRLALWSPPRTTIWPSWTLMKEFASRWPMIGWLLPSIVDAALVVVDHLVDVQLDAAVVADQRASP